MLILVLLGMYFDAVVVSICNQPDNFIEIGSGHTVYGNIKKRRQQMFQILKFYTAAADNLLCMKNGGTQWTMVSYSKH